MEFKSPRLNAILYFDICQKKHFSEKIPSIAFFINKFIKLKHRQMHIMSFLGNKGVIIDDIDNMQPIALNANSIHILYKNNDLHHFDKISDIYVKRGILIITQISDGNKTMFEFDNGRYYELGAVRGIKYSSIVGRTEFIKNIVIYNM